ncbi:3-hydroxyacyl-[acyl-carrier-protein] dehydratase FabZ [Bordetella genomosp. 10]|uniref:3-hydroxyacyl-[acyl-carrier-protein] dehydratase FabZ n=1 Tax=Bordetella genomosp. 10 TaxID=1416804 RepID=A0A261SD74_9BORD|nr:3-hydroxyacyl-ACP dehydratase FabZ [Bordetella genomosp. 10]OZI34932.1 3-hydroxyacyl-[acyl-carrier-protein] dehydratase FabZ [Bordetella genomosp. 10]
MELDIHEITARLPHRYPMLLIDRVLELVPQERILAVKNVSAGDSFSRGTDGGNLPMPGPLILEAMAQAAALFSFAEKGAGKSTHERPEEAAAVYYFLGVDDAKFLRPVLAGDCLRLDVRALRLSRSICKYRGQAYVGQEMVAEATLLCAVRST